MRCRGSPCFADTLEKAWNNGAGGPLAALIRIGVAYIDFARRQPAFYTAMFEAGIDHGSDPDLSRESNRAFGVLRDAAAAMHAVLPEARRAPPLMIALHIWTMAHGIASLFLRGDTARRNLPVAPEDLLESGRADLSGRARARPETLAFGPILHADSRMIRRARNSGNSRRACRIMRRRPAAPVVAALVAWLGAQRRRLRPGPQRGGAGVRCRGGCRVRNARPAKISSPPS